MILNTSHAAFFRFQSLTSRVKCVACVPDHTTLEGVGVKEKFCKIGGSKPPVAQSVLICRSARVDAPYSVHLHQKSGRGKVHSPSIYLKSQTLGPRFHRSRSVARRIQHKAFNPGISDSV